MRPTSVASTALLLTAVLLGCTRTPPALTDGVARTAPLTYAEIARLRRARDYFTLRDRLRDSPQATSPERTVAEALVQHAFNEPGASNGSIAVVLRDRNTSDSLAAELRQIAMSNHLRLFEYARGLAVADTLLADTTQLEASDLRDVRNMRRIFAALAAQPAQSMRVLSDTRVPLVEGRVAVTINDSTRSYVFDTGANLSTIMRSEARAVGMRILPAGINVGTSTDRRVVADLAVADHVRIGNVIAQHVVFLVLDDDLLSFPDGTRIPGIIGFPVIKHMGEVRLAGTKALVVPAVAPPRHQRNLALSNLTLLTPVGWQSQRLLCRLDTGADVTQLYEPFYRRFRGRVDSITNADTRTFGGAGGARELHVRVLREPRLTLGDTALSLARVDVLQQPIVLSQDDNYLDCNLGHDIFDRFAEVVLNFRDMAFVLR